MSDVLEPTDDYIDEKRLRELLRSHNRADAAELEAWLVLMPPEDAAQWLGEIARQAIPVWRLRLIYRYLGLLAAGACIGSIVLLRVLFDRSWLDALVAGMVVVSAAVLPLMFVPDTLAGGTQAALRLARTGDTRAVQFLARLWIPNPWTPEQARKNAQVTHELTRLLTERQGKRYYPEGEAALRDLLKRAFPKRNVVGQLLRNVLPVRDIGEDDAELLLTVARHVAHTTTIGSVRADAKADLAVLNHVAGMRQGTVQGEYRTLLRDTAQELLTVSARKGKP